MKRVLLLSTLGVLPFVASPAAAACVQAIPTITCTGESTGFTRNNTYNNLNITVQAGAVVTRGSDDTIRIRGAGNTVTNYGTIIGNGPATEEERTDGIDGGNNLTVHNYGRIEASNKAIDAEGRNGLTVYNYAGGVISAIDKAIRNAADDDGVGGDNAYLENHGLIESELDEGFEARNNAVIRNTGTIRASDDAIQVGENATIYNHGLIESVLRGGDEADPQDGIDIDSGYIYNYATGIIRSDDDAAIDYDESVIDSYIDNAGLISGTVGVLTDPLNKAGQHITNSGTIEGRNGLAIDVGFGDDSLTLLTGGKLIGGADFGAGSDALNIAGDFMEDIAGGALLDGGEGFDTATFAFNFADIVAAAFGAQSVTLSFLNGASDFSVALVNWESFSFADASYSYDELKATLAPVPLPASALLLLAGMGGLAALRRRRG